MPNFICSVILSLSTDRNECKEGSARCYHHSRCVNVKGGYRCICDPGYAPWGRMCMGKLDSIIYE